MVIVVVGRDSWMIDIPVVQKFGLTGVMSMWSQVLTLVRAVSHSWSRCCNAGAGLQLVLEAGSPRIKRIN